MIRKNKNYCRVRVGRAEREASNGAEYYNCNFRQLLPHTKIFEGFKNITFNGCDLTNCDVPADSNMVDCKTKQISFCSHLMREMKLVRPCKEECEHVIDTKKLKIDGKIAEQFFTYQHKEVE